MSREYVLTDGLIRALFFHFWERMRPRVQWPAPLRATFPHGKIVARRRGATTLDMGSFLKL